jgi:hypothetical protein
MCTRVLEAGDDQYHLTVQSTMKQAVRMKACAFPIWAVS